jgi:hypothetical protein
MYAYMRAHVRTHTHTSNVTIVIYLTDTSFNSTSLIKLLGQRAVNFTKGFKKQEKAFLNGLIYVWFGICNTKE